MGIFIFILFVTAIVIIIAIAVKKATKVNKTLLECPYTYKSSGPRSEKMYACEIKGTYYRGITVDHYCDAYIIFEPCKEDETAIAVYSTNGVHLGYLPRECEFKTKVMEYLKEKGKVNGYAIIQMADTIENRKYRDLIKNVFKTRLPKSIME